MDERDEELDLLEEESPQPKPAPQPAPAAPGDSKSFVDRAWGTQHNLERKWDSLGSGRFARVLRMARKPEPEEFRQSATIVLVGIGVIGGLGFMVYLFMRWILKLVGA